MTHHHHYFTTPSPYNITNDDDNTSAMTIYGIIFIIFGFLIIYNYIKYVQSRNRPPNNIIYQDVNVNENEEEGFPDINDFFPAYLEQDRNNPRRQEPVIAAPPPYIDEEQRSLQEIEPPSYDSILHAQDNPVDNEERSDREDENQSVV
tara:strand:+ start:261 stop:704 length:444 start_codon:yes stop_codon:yes gene_type:complete